jgi:hypothetical protein
VFGVLVFFFFYSGMGDSVVVNPSSMGQTTWTPDTRSPNQIAYDKATQTAVAGQPTQVPVPTVSYDDEVKTAVAATFTAQTPTAER